MSDNPNTIPPSIDLDLPHEHRCRQCGDMIDCPGHCDIDDYHLCAVCEKEGR